MKVCSLIAACICSLSLLGCQSLNQGLYREDLVTESGEPAYITVQHCLIGFEGTVGNVTRSREEAEQLATELFQRAQAGEDFDIIVSQYTDDTPPGIYKMANRGFEGDSSSRVNSKRIYERDSMVPAFGDTGFPLAVGAYGLAVYDPDNSPYGWHIVKRVR
jgi:hypothetical protein